MAGRSLLTTLFPDSVVEREDVTVSEALLPSLYHPGALNKRAETVHMEVKSGRY